MHDANGALPLYHSLDASLGIARGADLTHAATQDPARKLPGHLDGVDVTHRGIRIDMQVQVDGSLKQGVLTLRKAH